MITLCHTHTHKKVVLRVLCSVSPFNDFRPLAGWVEVTGNGEALDKDDLHTREPITAWNMQYRHNNKDLSHPQQLSAGMHVNTRYINSTRGTSSKKDAPRWHTHTHIYIYPTIRAHSVTQVLMMMMMSWCLMPSDVIWHIRDKLWPIPKHGSIKSTYVRCMRV